MFKKIFYFLQLIIAGVYRIVRDYVVPVINFMQAIKELLDAPVEGKDGAKNAYSKERFAEILKLSEEIIERLIYSFVAAVKDLLPELAPPQTTYYNVIKNFIKYVKDLPEGQRNMIFFKVASYMLLHWQKASKQKEVTTEHQADLLVQMVYSYNEKRKTC